MCLKNKIPRTAIRGKCPRGAYKINQLHYITKEGICQMRTVKICRCAVCGKTYYPKEQWKHIFYTFGRVRGACSEKCAKKGQENADKLRREREVRR